MIYTAAHIFFLPNRFKMKNILLISAVILLSTSEIIAKSDVALRLKESKPSHWLSKRNAECPREVCDSCRECQNKPDCDDTECSYCNNCDTYDTGCNNCDTSDTGCNNCGGEETISRSNTQSHNTDNKVSIQNKDSSANAHNGKVNVHLLNTVHNLNLIKNPVDIENNNHFSYDGQTSSKSDAQVSSQVPFYPPFRPVPPSYPPIRQECCGTENCGRPPMLIPPFIPQPPPCYNIRQRAFMPSCVSPAPYVVPGKRNLKVAPKKNGIDISSDDIQIFYQRVR